MEKTINCLVKIIIKPNDVLIIQLPKGLIKDNGDNFFQGKCYKNKLKLLYFE